MNNPKAITCFNFASLTLYEQEVVQELIEFKFLSSRSLITLDQGDDSEIYEYLGEFENDLCLEYFLRVL